MRFIVVSLFVLAGAAQLAGQTPPPVVTADDYARAERMLIGRTSRLVAGLVADPTWLTGHRLVYRRSIPEGQEFIRVDAERGTRGAAFDHAKLAASLSAVAGTTYEPFGLPVRLSRWVDDGRALTFDVGEHQFRCDIETCACTLVDAAARKAARDANVSPDGKRAAFIRDHNLWVRDLARGVETQLTMDGIEDYGYATNNAGWIRGDGPVLAWSPDSKKIATFQHDGRKAGEMYLVSTRVGHPELSRWKYPLPGDPDIFTLRRVVVDLEESKVVSLLMPPDPHRSTITDHVADRDGTWLDVEWSDDSSTLAFVSSSRDHKQATLRLADPRTGEVRQVLEEKVETFFESGNDKINWHVLAESNEVLWYSQRDDWGHLYLYDLKTGELVRQITSGAWNVLQVLHLDKTNRTIYFTGSGREPGDPYFEYLYRVKFDGTGLERLTPEPAHHALTCAPSGRYCLDRYSTPDTPTIAVLRHQDGGEVLALEKADVSRLEAGGWRPPMPFTVKARDNDTDLFGLMYRPSTFDPSRSYPVLNYIYPGPQSGSVGTRSFSPSRGDKQALAELGFIVVELDAMGTPGRSKTFHEAYYGNMGDNGLPDQMAGIRQLAARHPYLDLERVGVWGHSGGGFASTAAILRYPDFYKVAVSSAGNHDNRSYEDDWAEKWQGLLETRADGTTNYDNQANQLVAGNLKGKLLLAHGTMDSNVPPYSTLLVVNALMAANKDFDLLMFPNRGHGFGNEPYMMRRRWDYFVRHLLGAEPPKEYEITLESTR
jgi:dipeptidyl aminopeptidase/acylaminoacyl peptidase